MKSERVWLCCPTGHASNAMGIQFNVDHGQGSYGRPSIPSLADLAEELNQAPTLLLRCPWDILDRVEVSKASLKRLACQWF